MKNKMFQAIMPIIMGITTYLGYGSVEDIPIDAVNQKSNFNAAEQEKLKAALGDDYEKTMLGIDQVIKDFHNKDMNAKSLADDLKALVQENQLLVDAQDTTTSDDAKVNLDLLKANIEKISADKKQLQATVQQLLKESVGDIPMTIVTNPIDMKKHSATHLFASGHDFDAFENRNWNARLAAITEKGTNFFEDSVVPLLQNDIKHFVRENPAALQSLFNDVLGLPSDWDVRTGVIDSVADGFVIPAELVQGRNKGWSPNQKIKILAELGNVFRKKIDIEFSGYELQNIENTWIRSYNGNDGSHPFKMSFVGFLISEIMKQRMVDDRIAQINGIFSDNFGGNDNPGRNIDSQDGLRYNFFRFRDIEKKYTPFDLGVPTESNIVDYVKNLILSIPEIERSEQGLELGLSQAWLDAYRTRAGAFYQHHRNTDQGKLQYDLNSPIDYPNIKFQPLRDMTKTDFMYVTQSKNIQVLEYKTAEKTQLTVGKGSDPRNITMFADYRQGIRFIFVGSKKAAGESNNFELQKIWSNSLPIFDKDTTMPLYDNKTGIIEFHFNNMKVNEKFATNIVQIDKVPVGMIIRITGNTGLAATKNVVKNAQLDLTSNFNLATGGTLTLIAKQDGTLKELKRTTAPEAIATTDKTFSTTTLDATNGSVYKYKGAVATLANILGGYDGKEITIYGNTTALTVSDVSGIIDVTADAVLDTATKYIKLAVIDGVWIETARG
jgi:hypothetical protein